MAAPQASPAVPVPLEQYAQAYDDLFHTRIQRERFRVYLAGLLLPRDRNKTLTALAGAEPIVQAQTAPVQQLQFFLTEADCGAEAVTARRIERIRAEPLTAPHTAGVLVIDETGVRKDGRHTAHVGYQYLGSIGKTANGIVAVTSAVWADERVYYPLQVRPSTPAARLAGGKQHPAFRTKPQLALELVQAARAAGIPFRAVVADSLYGEHPEFTRTMWQADIPYVLAIKPSQVVWTPPPEPESPWAVLWEAADRLRWTARNDAERPGAWTAVVRRFHDGHEETWWALDLRLGSYAPEYPTRLVVATADPRTLPAASTWYLVTNCRSRARRAPRSIPPCRRPIWPRQRGSTAYGSGSSQGNTGDKQVKQELGWADFQVRSDRAIRRHWELVCCAFCFCWWADSSRLAATTAPALAPPPAATPPPGAGKMPPRERSRRRRPPPTGSPPPCGRPWRPIPGLTCPRICPRGPEPCGRCRPGLSPGTSYNAAGRRGQRLPCHPISKRCWTPSPPANPSTAICVSNKVPIRHAYSTMICAEQDHRRVPLGRRCRCVRRHPRLFRPGSTSKGPRYWLPSSRSSLAERSTLPLPELLHPASETA